MKPAAIAMMALGVLFLGITTRAGDIPKDQTQSGMNHKANEEYQQADEKLNDVYKQVLTNQADEKAREKLKAAEKLWIQFRDAECESEADEYRGGSIVPMIYSQCGTRLTLERVKQLQDRLEH